MVFLWFSYGFPKVSNPRKPEENQKKTKRNPKETFETFVQVPVYGWRRYRSLHWVSSVSVQVYCELLARVPVTTTPAPLIEYLTPRGKAL